MQEYFKKYWILKYLKYDICHINLLKYQTFKIYQYIKKIFNFNTHLLLHLHTHNIYQHQNLGNRNLLWN